MVIGISIWWIVVCIWIVEDVVASSAVIIGVAEYIVTAVIVVIAKDITATIVVIEYVISTIIVIEYVVIIRIIISAISLNCASLDCVTYHTATCYWHLLLQIYIYRLTDI